MREKKKKKQKHTHTQTDLRKEKRQDTQVQKFGTLFPVSFLYQS